MYYGVDRVVFVGMATTTREDHTDEFPVVALNESPVFDYLKRLDHLFQIHEEEDFSRINNPNHPNHIYWLTNEEGPCHACEGTGFAWDPKFNRRSKVKKCMDKDCSKGVYSPSDRPLDVTIWMQEEYPEIPGSRKYPLDEIIEATNFPISGKEEIKRRYFTNSQTYAMGLASYDDSVDRMDIFGVEAASDTEWAYQKPGIEFWGGYLGGQGKTVWVPESCRLFNQGLYGYEVGMYMSRQEIERYMRKYKKDWEAAQRAGDKLIGKLQQLEQLARASNSPQQRESYQRQAVKIQQQLGQKNGQIAALHAIYAFAKFQIGRIDGRHPESASPATLEEIQEDQLESEKELQGK